MMFRMKPLAMGVVACLPVLSSSLFAQQHEVARHEVARNTPVIGEAVVVTATRQAQRASEVLSRVEVIDRETIDRAGQATLVDLLRAQPGIRVASNGGAGANASVFMRGAESRHTLLIVDGMRLGAASSGQPTLEAIPLSMIERIEILRGPASALYGSEAIGGVIQIFTRKGEAGFHPEAFVGAGTQGTVQANAHVAGGEGRLRYSLSLGQDETDGFNAKRDPAYWTTAWGNSYDPDKDGFRNRFVNASASLGFRERDELGVNLYRSDGRNWYDVSTTFDSYLDKRLSAASAYMTNALTDDWSSTLRVGRSGDELRNHADAVAPSVFDTTQTQLIWQHDIRLAVGSLMLAYDHVDAEVSGTTAYTVDERTVKAWLAGWSGQIDRHNLQVNVRHDDNSQFGGKTTGLLAYGYRLSAQWGVSASVATAFNAPTFNQLYWPDTGFGGGNPDLKPEEALNRELGVRWDDGMSGFEATYFNNRVKDMISGWPAVNVNRARLEGVELLLRTRLAGFDVQMGMDWLKAEDEHTGRKLPRRAAQAGFVRVDRSTGNWSYGMELSGEGRRFDDAANRVRLGGYGVLDAYAHYRFAPDWRLEMRASNLLDKEYELARGYAMPGAAAFVGVRYTPAR